MIYHSGRIALVISAILSLKARRAGNFSCSTFLLSSSLLSNNLKIKVYRTTNFLLFCKGVKLGQNKKKDQPAPTVNALSKLLHL